MNIYIYIYIYVYVYISPKSPSRYSDEPSPREAPNPWLPTQNPSTAEARKLEHERNRTPNQRKKERQDKSAYIHVKPCLSIPTHLHVHTYVYICMYTYTYIYMAYIYIHAPFFGVRCNAQSFGELLGSQRRSMARPGSVLLWAVAAASSQTSYAPGVFFMSGYGSHCSYCYCLWFV